MSNNDTKYKISRVLLLVIQYVFIAIGFVATTYQMIHNFTQPEVSSQNAIITIIGFVAYIAVINYVIWGYKKKYIPYNISITLYLILLTATFVRLTDIANAGKEGFYIYGTCIFVAITMCLVIGFQNTFKNYKPKAMVLGGIIVALELMMAIGAIVMLTGNDFTSVNDIMIYQPFSRFFISSVLYIAFIARTKWREHEKELAGEK